MTAPRDSDHTPPTPPVHALASGGLEGDVDRLLTRVQNDLFDVGADFCTPVVPDPEFPPLRIEQAYVDRLERWCDHYNEGLPTLRSFILNGGTPTAAHLHVCRTVCRRAERRVLACGDEVNAECVRYLNRLSDLLFILSRGAILAVSGEEPLWQPGAGQS